ncbi:hypothetical protein CHARACLAT_011573 [Characodon lateralis]|uniref:Ras-related protein Rab-26 n=1 Tax=Characodon lateralis TaxID=208331 RepID=A0ABU7EST0_9TELE|nr:hypothetical protein [Characodon lateralis]
MLSLNSISGSSVIDMEDTQTLPSKAFPYNEELTHKTILVGDSGVGKTSLLVQFDQGKFIPGSFTSTVGIGFTVSSPHYPPTHPPHSHTHTFPLSVLLLLPVVVLTVV